MLAQNIIFGFLAFAMGVAAVKLVSTQNIVHAALYLVVVLSGLAAQYILLAAEFVAVAQVLVYIGAVMVLILFGVMLTRAPIGKAQNLDNNQRGVAALVAVFLFGALSALLMNGFGRTELDLTNTVATGASGGNNITIADSIFSQYLLPFEVVSILLLAALVGAIVIARRD